MKRVLQGILIFSTLALGQNLSTEKNINNIKNHSLQQVNCKTCHSCDVPTKQDPCLNPCPRDLMITVNQTPEQGPNVVKLDELSDKYMPVIFSHKVHAQMSQMSGGCQSCHHYNTSGPILPCSNCHSSDRKREDLSKPDLQAAYHRQCINCHKEWSHSTDCVSCHALKISSAQNKVDTKKSSSKSHPNIKQPDKLVYETNYNKGKLVTFFHNQHVKLFGAECVNCHAKQNCTRCHDKELNSKVVSSTLPIKINKPANEHHQPCFKCHSNDSCSKCHKEKEMEPFNHGISTGWVLNKFHEKLECTKCHINNNFSSMENNCISCHKNFNASFNHSLTGLKLDETHSALECGDCHLENNFAKQPSCTNCHDDKSFPKQKPGNLVKLTKK